jgi:hypothetical protein
LEHFLCSFPRDKWTKEKRLMITPSVEQSQNFPKQTGNKHIFLRRHYPDQVKGLKAFSRFLSAGTTQHPCFLKQIHIIRFFCFCQDILTKFSILNTLLEFLPVSEVYKTLLPVGLALGVGIGFVGSFLTIKKHLKA